MILNKIEEKRSEIESFYDAPDPDVFYANTIIDENEKKEFIAFFSKQSIKIDDSIFNFYNEIESLDTGWNVKKYDAEELFYAQSYNTITHLYYIRTNELVANHKLIQKDDSYRCLTQPQKNYNVFLRFEEGQTKLYLYLPNGNLYPIPLSFEDYVRLFIKTAGMEYWELYVLDEFPPELLHLDYDGFFENMEYIFPNEDLSEFKHRELFEGKKSLLAEMGNNTYRHQFDKAFENFPSEKASVYKVGMKDIGMNSIAYIRQIELERNAILPKAFKQFYLAFNSFVVRWTAFNGAAGIGSFLSLGECFSGFQGYYHAYPKTTADFIDFAQLNREAHPNLEGLHPVFQGEQETLAFRITENGCQFYRILYTDGNTYQTDFIPFTFDEILEAFMQSRGLNYWISALIKDPSFYKDFMRNMNTLFPEANLDLFS